jgi:transmembrane sensor
VADLSSKLKDAAGRLEPGWSETQLRSLANATEHRLVRRQRVKVVGAAMVVLCAVATATLFVSGKRADVEVSASGLAVVHGEASVRTLVVNGDETQLELTGGQARFSVEPQGRRRVSVLSGQVRVEVVGTVFIVERRQQQVRVAVDEGVVRVTVGGVEQRTVRAGEVALFDDSLPVNAPVEKVEAEPEPLPPSPAPTPVKPPVPPRTPKNQQRVVADSKWRDLAAAGAFDEAWAALQLTLPRDEPEELLMAADVARLSRHPRAAIAPLERVIARFPADARAPLAAFTLGRLHLEDLGDALSGAEAFAKARTLAPRGPLAPDALAREVECLARAGAKERAVERARLYLSEYPTGARAAAVRQWAGLKAE